MSRQASSLRAGSASHRALAQSPLTKPDPPSTTIALAVIARQPADGTVEPRRVEHRALRRLPRATARESCAARSVPSQSYRSRTRTPARARSASASTNSRPTASFADDVALEVNAPLGGADRVEPGRKVFGGVLEDANTVALDKRCAGRALEGLVGELLQSLRRGATGSERRARQIGLVHAARNLAHAGAGPPRAIFPHAAERCPRGRRGRPAKALYGLKPVSRVRIPLGLGVTTKCLFWRKVISQSASSIGFGVPSSRRCT